MALHLNIQRLLLIGVRIDVPPRPAEPRPPRRLLRLIESLGAAHRRFDERAVHFGHRYRSGYWMIYILSAFAVLCAVLSATAAEAATLKGVVVDGSGRPSARRLG